MYNGASQEAISRLGMRDKASRSESLVCRDAVDTRPAETCRDGLTLEPTAEFIDVGIPGVDTLRLKVEDVPRGLRPADGLDPSIKVLGTLGSRGVTSLMCGAWPLCGMRRETIDGVANTVERRPKVSRLKLLPDRRAAGPGVPAIDSPS